MAKMANAWGAILTNMVYLANTANMSNMANTRQSLNKNSNDMAKPFANGECGENVEYSESSSRLSLKSGNFGEYGVNDEFVVQGPLWLWLCIGQIEASTCPAPPGIPRAFDTFAVPGRREFNHQSLAGGGEFEFHPRFHVKSLTWRAIMGDAVS